MKYQKAIVLLIILFTFGWTFNYFLAYLHQDSIEFMALLSLLIIWVLLLVVALYQIIKFLISKQKDTQRLFYAALILMICFVSYMQPSGLISWEKYEEDAHLVAVRGGMLNCETLIELKSNQKVKYTSLCFDRDFIFGTYKVSNDTIFMSLERSAPYMDKDSYAVLKKWNDSLESFSHLHLYENYDNNRSLTFVIKEIDMDRLMK